MSYEFSWSRFAHANKNWFKANTPNGPKTSPGVAMLFHNTHIQNLWYKIKWVRFWTSRIRKIWVSFLAVYLFFVWVLLFSHLSLANVFGSDCLTGQSPGPPGIRMTQLAKIQGPGPVAFSIPVAPGYVYECGRSCLWEGGSASAWIGLNMEIWQASPRFSEKGNVIQRLF